MPNTQIRREKKGRYEMIMLIGVSAIVRDEKTVVKLLLRFLCLLVEVLLEWFISFGKVSPGGFLVDVPLDI